MSDDLPFDLALSEEQRIMRDSIQRFATQQMRELARDADEAGQPPEGFYDASCELGLTLLPIPEDCGGAGQPREPMSNVLAAEDLGYGDMSLAMGALAPLGFINAVLDFGTTEQQQAFLSPMASETFVPASIALMEGRATFEPGQLQTRAVASGDGYVLDGEKRLVPLGCQAQQLLVVAALEDGSPAAFVVPAGAEGLSAEAADYMGLRSLETATVTLQGVKVPALNRLANFDLERLVDLSRLGIAAMAVGCCQAILDYCIPYANERTAFGEPISRRQSVAFMIANMAIELEGMRLLVWRAASRAQQGLPFHREAYLARVLCAEKAMEIGTNGIQVFGGAGFIRDYPLEMWYRNLRAVGLLEGAVMA